MRGLVLIGAVFMALFGFTQNSAGDVSCLTGTPTATGGISFSGIGAGVSDPISLDAEVALFSGTSDIGDGTYLTIQLLPAPGQPSKEPEYILFIDGDKPFNGAVAHPIMEAGEYVIVMDNPGARSWTIVVEQ